jgi:SPP1 family predicted phage head-tail adaptor
MYSEIIYLIDTAYSKDDIGNTIATETKIKCYAELKNVGTKEFYGGYEVGLTPTYEFKIRKSNYHNESLVEYEGNRYTVIRTGQLPDNNLFVVVGVKKGDA